MSMACFLFRYEIGRAAEQLPLTLESRGGCQTRETVMNDACPSTSSRPDKRVRMRESGNGCAGFESTGKGACLKSKKKNLLHVALPDTPRIMCSAAVNG